MLFTRILIAACFAAYMVPAEACELSFAYTEHPSPPYLEGEGMTVPPKPGVAIDIVIAVANQAGCTVHLARLANLRVLRSVRIGEADGAILYSYDADRGRDMAFPMKGHEPDTSRRLATLNYYLYRRHGGKLTWDGVNLDNPDGLPIGINSGFSIADLLSKLGVKLDEVPTTEQNLGKLSLGRISGYAMQEHVADPAIRRMHLEDQIEKLPVPLQSKNYYVTFSHKFYAAHPDVAEKIWSAIAEKREPMTKSLAASYRD